MRAIAATLGIVALLVLAGTSLQRGWADILAFQGRGILPAWESRPRKLSTEAWERAGERLRRAHALDPANPNVTEGIARLHELRARGRPAAAAAADLRIALGYLRQSVLARPGSPYTWANIAFVKSRLAERDAEYLRALRHAAAFGPWEPEVQLMLAEMGLRDWDLLPGPARNVVRAALSRGLKRQDARLFDLARRHGKLHVLCATPGVQRSGRALACI